MHGACNEAETEEIRRYGMWICFVGEVYGVDFVVDWSYGGVLAVER